MLSVLGGWLAKSVLMQSPAGAFLKRLWDLSGKIPWQVWAAIFAAIALWLGFRWHGHQVHKTYASGYAAAKAADDALIAELRQRATTAATNGKAISQDTRSKNDAQAADIHATAAAIGVRGPGAASCRRIGDPAVSAASGQPVAPGDQRSDAAPGPVPAADGQPDLAAVPWQWLVGRAEQADLDRSEVLSWRDWYQRQAAEWAKLKADDGRKPAHQ